MYIVKRFFYNDYRCCCFQSWEADILKVESFKEAMEYCPDDYPFNSPNSSLYNVQVYEEGEDGLDLIAVGSLSWPANKDQRYDISYWATIDVYGGKSSRIIYKNNVAVKVLGDAV